MAPPWPLKWTASLLLLASACQQPAATVTAEKEFRPHKAKEAKGRVELKVSDEDQKGQEKTDEAPQKYALPFAWETSKAEPLSLIRAFLKESFEDNTTYMEHGQKFFARFADAELPRATVVACSDSRVQPQAWDETSENDDYTVRNFGNTLAGDEGSIEYGVEHLNTPLLLILGHTGCSAVKAASGDTSKLSKSLQARLKNLQLSRPRAGKNENLAWAESVLDNVHNQVAVALSKYGKRVQGGTLTVVGAVLDFRNDLGHGPGKFLVVDVNGNAEPERMAAFMAAIIDESPPGKGSKKPTKEARAHEDALRSLERVKGIVSRETLAAESHEAPAAQHFD